MIEVEDHSAFLRVTTSLQTMFDLIESHHGTEQALQLSLMMSQYLMVRAGVRQCDVSADCKRMRDRWAKEMARHNEELSLVDLITEDLVR
jgi:hypothetical protein